MKILAFGIAKEIVGSPVAEVPVTKGMTAGALMAALGEQYPALKKLTSLALAVNGAYAKDDIVITDSDELALIPPVSGG